MSSSQILEKTKEVLAGHAEVDLGIVFGSMARATATERSDVDVAILGKRADALGIAAALSRELGRDVQIVSLENADIPMLESIIEEGIVVYERVHGIAAGWRSRTLMDLELDGPWYARQRDAWLRRVAGRGL